MRERLWRRPEKILDNASANGVGTAKNANFHTVILTVSTDNDAELTLKVYGSSADQDPNDWASAASPENEIAPMGLYDMDSRDFVAGSTGVVFTGEADYVRRYILNGEAKWINVIVSDYVKGNVNVSISGINNT